MVVLPEKGKMGGAKIRDGHGAEGGPEADHGGNHREVHRQKVDNLDICEQIANEFDGLMHKVDQDVPNQVDTELALVGG